MWYDTVFLIQKVNVLIKTLHWCPVLRIQQLFWQILYFYSTFIFIAINKLLFKYILTFNIYFSNCQCPLQHVPFTQLQCHSLHSSYDDIWCGELYILNQIISPIAAMLFNNLFLTDIIINFKSCTPTVYVINHFPYYSFFTSLNIDDKDYNKISYFTFELIYFS